MTAPAQPTHIRRRIIGVTMLTSFHHDLSLSKEQIGQIPGAFFFAFALLKVGGGDGNLLVFFTLTSAFVLAGLIALSMDATKQLVAGDSPNVNPTAP